MSRRKRPAVTGRKRKALRIFGQAVKYIFLMLLIGAGVTFLVLFPKLKEYNKEAVEQVALSTKATFSPNTATRIYDAKGSLIASVSSENKKFAYLEGKDIPQNVRNAYIAIEDRTFETNRGYDMKAMARVGINYVLSKGDEAHGASTITQQLAKLTFLTNEKSVTRKVRELFYARALTKKYSKDEIMEFYVNNTLYANSIYGIEEAARQYFGKPAKDLTLSQTAYLCAIPNRPEYYNPWKHPENAIPRRNKILDDMAEMKFITKREASDAKAEKIEIVPRKQKDDPGTAASTAQNYQASYAISCAAEYVMKLNGFEFQSGFRNDDDYKAYRKKYKEAYEEARKDIYARRYTITTSLDPDAQAKVQKAVDEALKGNREKGKDGKSYALQGAATAVDLQTGKVVAVAGGRTQDGVTDSMGGLNRAFQSYRQPGSTFKPLFVYGPALDTGKYSAGSTLQNISVKAARKSKDIASMKGEEVSLYQALVKSMNGPAYWLAAKNGASYDMSFIQKMRFDRILPSDTNLSTALGGMTYGVTTTEMASAYAAIASSGRYRSPSCIVSMKDMNGTEIYDRKDEEAPDPEISVYSSSAARKLTDIMKGVLTEGTARNVGWNSRTIDAAGKTGTTNDNRDVSFAGFTPYYSLSVWVGYDDHREMGSRITGATYPAHIWKSAMESLTEGRQEAHFPSPDSGSTAKQVKIPYEHESVMPFYHPEEQIRDGYSVQDRREDQSTADRAEKEIRESSRLTGEERAYAFGSIADRILGIRDEDMRRRLTDTLLEEKGLSGDLPQTDTTGQPSEGGDEQ